MNAADFILPRGTLNPSIALLTASRNWSFRDLDHYAARIETLARHQNLTGHFCLLVDSNSAFWVAAYLGLMRAGVTVVPLPPGIAEGTLKSIIRLTECGTVLVPSPSAPYAELLRAAGLRLISETDLPESPEAREPLSTDSEDLASVVFTSGSTGTPRGVMIRHRNIIANAESILDSIPITSADRMMAVLPFCYAFGASILHTHLHRGASLVLSNSFMFPDRVLKQIQDTYCTSFAGVPSTFQILLRRSSLSKMEFPHLKAVQQAGGKLHPHLIEEVRAAFPGTSLFVMYGQTEATARLTVLPPEALAEKLGSVGRALSGIEIKILDENGQPLSEGEVGEVVACGPNIAGGYWNLPQESEQTFRSEGLFTGDLGRLDSDGYLYIVGRRNDFLKCAGYRTSAQEVENTLLKFPGTIEAAVVPIPDELLGEAVKVYLAHPNHSETTLSDFKAFCEKSLPLHLQPKTVTLVSSLPKNSAGKVQKGFLEGGIA